MARAKNAIQTTISLDGPFFTKDPGRTFRQNARYMMEELGALSQAAVTAELRAGESGRSPIRIVQPNRVSGHVVSSPVFGTRRRPDDLVVVTRIRNIGFTQRQARSLMAAGSEIEGRTHPFRRTAARLRRAGKIAQADLTKGL